jgi:EmrB/QacA subfamily drug resistance transporter
MGSFVALLDGTVVNVALPAIARDLGGGLQGQQWVVNSYLLLLGSLILIGGSLGDLYGPRRVFLFGIAGFGLASALCAAAPSIELLVGFRALQGVFGALLTPASLAIIVAVFEPDERGRAIGTWTAYSGIAAIIGPLVGGWLVDVLNWRWIFAINVPFVLLTLALATRMPRITVMVAGRRPDVAGAVQCALGLAGPVLGLIRQPSEGWSDPTVAVPIAAGLVLFTVFVWWERRAPDPMLPLALFRRGNFAWGNVETLLMYGGLGVLFFLLVVFLQQTGGYTALEAGLAMMPPTLVMFALSRRFGALADRRGPRLFMGFGPIVGAAGTLLMIVSIDGRPRFATEVLPGLVVFSILADAEERNAGIASGVNNAVARVASLLAISSIGAVTGGAVDLGGFRMGAAFAAGLMAVAGVIGLLRIRNPRRETHARHCPGGQLAGAPREAATVRPPGPAAPEPDPAR